MLRRICAFLALTAAVTLPLAAAEDKTSGLTEGTVSLKSSGPLAFGPNGVLFVADPIAATVYAIETGDNKAIESKDQPSIEGVNEKIASLLGTETKEVSVKDLAVNPLSGTTYMAVSRGTGTKATPVIVTATRTGKLAEFSLKNVKSASTKIENATTGAPPKGKVKGKGGNRMEAITHIAYVKGKLLIAGLSNEEFASNLRSVPYPFDKTNRGSSVEIYHGAHGAFETRSPIRVFAPYSIDGKEHILAAYTCTPLVKLPVASLEPGKKIMATTVAELGNRNRPLSMIVYNKGGKDYVLLANNARGLMKINLENVASIKGIEEKISGTAGLKYDTIKDVTGVQKLDAFGKGHAVVLIQDKSGKETLKTIELP